MHSLSYIKISFSVYSWQNWAGHVREQLLHSSMALLFPSKTSFWKEMGKIPAGKSLEALQKFAGMEQNGKCLFFKLMGRSRKQQIRAHSVTL